MSLDGDPGVQRERTALAWRRTSLSVLVCWVLAARCAAVEATLGWWAVLVVLSGLALTTEWMRRAVMRRSDAWVSPRLVLGASAVSLVFMSAVAAAMAMLAG